MVKVIEVADAAGQGFQGVWLHSLGQRLSGVCLAPNEVSRGFHGRSPNTNFLTCARRSTVKS
jgi:hypothetical protein